MKLFNRFVIVLSILAACAPSIFAQQYQVGDIVENFALNDRETGKPVDLTDFEGAVIFIEWFAHWCPFCKAAAAQTGPGITEYFGSRQGNSNGVPVVHLNINMQGGQEAATQQYIDFYKIGQVLNDFDAEVASRFFAGGQPIFAVINGVANSPSHEQWELVYSRFGYGDLEHPIETFRDKINSVQVGLVLPSAPPSFTEHPVSRTVAPGTEVTLSAKAQGDGDLDFSWSRDGVPIPDATGPELVLGEVSPEDAGDYALTVTNDAGSTASLRARVVVADPSPGLIVNLSVRAAAGVNGQPLIVGFVVSGGAKQMLIRGIGPTLSDFGVAGALANPMIELFSGNTSVLASDDWGSDNASTLQSTFATVGAFPLEPTSLDAALIGEISGAHTVHVSDKDGGSGITLAEVYDSGDGMTASLVNVSARNTISDGDGVLVTGFAINGNEPRRVLIRAAGPALGDFGLSGFLEDPILEIFEQTLGGPQHFATNDDWEDGVNAAEILSAVPGAFPFASGSKDAALLVVLPAGSYTAVASGVDGTTGEALVEVYEAP